MISSTISPQSRFHPIRRGLESVWVTTPVELLHLPGGQTDGLVSIVPGTYYVQACVCVTLNPNAGNGWVHETRYKEKFIPWDRYKSLGCSKVTKDSTLGIRRYTKEDLDMIVFQKPSKLPDNLMHV